MSIRTHSALEPGIVFLFFISHCNNKYYDTDSASHMSTERYAASGIMLYNVTAILQSIKLQNSYIIEGLRT